MDLLLPPPLCYNITFFIMDLLLYCIVVMMIRTSDLMIYYDLQI